MSVRSLSDLAVARVPQIEQGKARRGTRSQQDTDRTAAAQAAGEKQLGSWGDALTSSIPTEPLAAYTSLIGIIAGIGNHSLYVPLRWWIFVGFVVLALVSVWVAYVRKTPNMQRPVPVLPLVATALAAAAWGLVMPGSALNATLTGSTASVVTATITIGAAAVLGLIASPLSQKAANS